MDLSTVKLFNEDGKDYTFEDLVKEIYNSSKNRKAEIADLLKKTKEALTNNNSHSYIGPVIASYLDASVKNDDQLNKLATVIQRMVKDSNSGNDESDGSIYISEAEKQKLFSDVMETVKKNK